MIRISLAVFVLTVLTVRVFGRLAADAPTRLAIRAGMSMLLVSIDLGYLTSVVGYGQMDAGRSSDVYGAAGVLKFPHGAALHALQTLPLLGWVLSRLNRAVSLARMRWWVAAHLWFLIYSLLQTGTGRLRWDGNAVGMALVVLMLASAGLALWPAARRAVSVRRDGVSGSRGEMVPVDVGGDEHGSAR